MGKSVAALAGLCLTLTLALGACQKAGSDAVSAGDMSMGNPAAKVTMIEYASVSCPHCARFDMEVFPAFKAKYIDTGQVRYVAREALTGDPAIAAAGFLTARCAGKDKYFQVVDAIYHAQQEMFASGDPHATLLNIARSAGLTDAQFDKCIKDDAALKALNDRWEHYVKDDNINSTPTFVINGKVYNKGEMTLAELDAAVSEARASGKTAS
ncbi:MAG TPA: DsbA family protein [Caulobacteraceae bacterium]|nr:DsbA family protein [Caulobacteraceae bacterium]